VQWLDLGGDPLDHIHCRMVSDGKTLLVDKSDLYIKTGAAARRSPDRTLAAAAPGADPTMSRRNVVDWRRMAAHYFISDRDNDYHVYYQPCRRTPKPVTQETGPFSRRPRAAANALFVVTNQGKAEERQTFRVPLRGGRHSA